MDDLTPEAHAIEIWHLPGWPEPRPIPSPNRALQTMGRDVQNRRFDPRLPGNSRRVNRGYEGVADPSSLSSSRRTP